MTFETERSLASEELTWLAEQYVLGELDASQRDAFEVRLASDQTAREAVASAVALMAASHEAPSLQSATPKLTPVRVSAWMNRVAWFSGVVASLALAAFLVWQVTRDKIEASTDLARAWSETRESIGDEVDEEALAVMETNGVSLEEVDVPEWLITAVSLNEEAMPDAKRSTAKPDAGEGA